MYKLRFNFNTYFSLFEIWYVMAVFLMIYELKNKIKQAGAELGQAQLPTGIWLYWD